MRSVANKRCRDSTTEVRLPAPCFQGSVRIFCSCERLVHAKAFLVHPSPTRPQTWSALVCTNTIGYCAL